MIRSQRYLDSPSIGVRHDIAAWVAESARVHVVQTVGLTCDDRLFQMAFGRADQGERAMVTIVLRGRLFLKSRGRCEVVEAGQALYLPRKGELCARTEGGHYQSLVLEWDASAKHAPRRLDVERSRFAGVAEVICSAAPPDPDALIELWRLVHELAPSNDRCLDHTHLQAPRELRAQEVADALDAVLSSLATQPMATDLEVRLGVGGRQVARMLEAFRARYGYGDANWLETRKRRRLLLAATLMTADRATVGAVAEEVGYHRPETLARAFALAGLPKPSAVKQQVTEYRNAWCADVAAHDARTAESGSSRGASSQLAS